jgi:hypothetical protein
MFHGTRTGSISKTVVARSSLRNAEFLAQAE